VITILVVAGAADDLGPAFARHPSVEVLAAADAEDALEKLARNRRIDAVLLLGGPGAGAVAHMIREEDPGAPPVYALAGAGEIPHAFTLADSEPAAAVEVLAHLLQPRG
jgi:CheY-like chemotaxis protein